MGSAPLRFRDPAWVGTLASRRNRIVPGIVFQYATQVRR